MSGFCKQVITSWVHSFSNNDFCFPHRKEKVDEETEEMQKESEVISEMGILLVY